MPPAEPSTIGKIPWEMEKTPEDRAKAAHEAFGQVMDEQGNYRSATLKHMRLYRNLNSLGYVVATNPATGLSSQLSLNVCRNMVNSVHSKIGKHRVKATFQTAGASYEMREKSRKLDGYALGLGQKEGIYNETPMALLDALVTGRGYMKTFADKKRKRVRFERKFSPDIVVDFAEGAYLHPAHYHEINYIDKHYLARKYPDKADEILAVSDTAADDDAFYVFQESPSGERIRVVESYYFNPDDEFDGYRVLQVNGISLEDGAYTSGNPYSTMTWSLGNLGWQGMGLPEELRGIQLEINRLVRKIQNAFGLLANPYILADRSAAIARGQLTDIPGSVVLYNGKAPNVIAPQTVHAEVFAHLDRLYQRAYEIAGVSQMNAQSQKPAGLESGRAMLVYEDIESDRFAAFHRQWDELHVDCFRKGIRAAKSIPGYKVQVYGKGTYEVLDFNKDIDLEEDEWTIRPMPTAFLGETPPAQLDNAERLAKSGLIPDPTELLEEVTSPDIAAYVSRVTAPKRLAEKMVASMLAGGKYVSPEPEMNLALTLSVAQEMYCEHRLIDDFPEKRLELVRRFMKRTKDLMKMAGGPAATPSMGAVAAPGGPPPIPTSPVTPPPTGAAPPALAPAA